MKKDQDFPICIEVQLLGGRESENAQREPLHAGNQRRDEQQAHHSALCQLDIQDLSRRSWVRVEVEVLGDSEIKHMVEGQTVISYQKPQIGGGNVTNFDPEVKKDGMLLKEAISPCRAKAIRSSSARWNYSTLSVAPIRRPQIFKTYYVKSDNSQCRYAGSAR